MTSELTREEMRAINGGKEISPEDLGYQVGRFAGKMLMVWATFFKKA